MTRDEIVAEARTWMDVPWRHQGRSRDGIDCVGLLSAVGKAFGVPHSDISAYPRQAVSPKLRNLLRSYLNPMPFTANKVGMVGVFRDSIFPCHVGILSWKHNRLHVIHARADAGKVIEEAFSDERFNLVEVLAFPGLED